MMYRCFISQKVGGLIMADLTDPDDKWLQQEKEWEKEELRREKVQEKLRKERAERQARFCNYVSAVVHIKAKKGKVFFSQSVFSGQGALHRSVLAMRRLHSLICRGASICLDTVSAFAARPLSIPVFLLSAAVMCVIAVHCCGFTLLSLQTETPLFQFYLCDYSVGFCSRLFVGAVIGLFADKLTVDNIDWIVKVSIVLSLAGQVVLVGLFMRRGFRNRSFVAALLAGLFLFDPLIATANVAAPGMLDVYLLILFFIWLLFLKTPLTVFVTPVFIIVGMAIHYEFLFTFMPPMLSLLLYYAYFSKNKHERLGKGAAFICGSVVAAVSFIYFVFFAKDFLRMNSDGFYQHMLSRFVINRQQRELYTHTMGAPIFRDYFDYYIFGEFQGKNYYQNISDFFDFLLNWRLQQFSLVELLRYLALFVPVWLLLSVVWWRCAAHEKGMRKLPYLCFIGQAFVLVPEIIISTDNWRWFSAALFAQLAVFSVVYLDEDAELHSYVDVLHSKRMIMASLIVSITYAVCRFPLVKGGLP